jgi:E3 ubiquitin-protein ligase mind-bomb
MAEGLRVVRGPDWNLGNEDKGEGHVGTVVKDNGDQTYDVFWDMGGKSTCRVGKGGKFDLRILDNAPVGKYIIQFLYFFHILLQNNEYIFAVGNFCDLIRK